jgi:hypothetical protein
MRSSEASYGSGNASGVPGTSIRHPGSSGKEPSKDGAGCRRPWNPPADASLASRTLRNDPRTPFRAPETLENKGGCDRSRIVSKSCLRPASGSSTRLPNRAVGRATDTGRRRARGAGGHAGRQRTVGWGGERSGRAGDTAGVPWHDLIQPGQQATRATVPRRRGIGPRSAGTGKSEGRRPPGAAIPGTGGDPAPGGRPEGDGRASGRC